MQCSRDLSGWDMRRIRRSLIMWLIFVHRHHLACCGTCSMGLLSVSGKLEELQAEDEPDYVSAPGVVSYESRKASHEVELSASGDDAAENGDSILQMHLTESKPFDGIRSLR